MRSAPFGTRSVAAIAFSALLLAQPSCRSVPSVAEPAPQALSVDPPQALPVDPPQALEELEPSVEASAELAPSEMGIELVSAEAPLAAAAPIGGIPRHAAADCGPAPAPIGCGCCDTGCPGDDCANRPKYPNEYLCDGDDAPPEVRLSVDGQVLGLDTEDTVAIWDHDDGRTEIVASNRVCIYAPRFAAVRKVLTPHVGAGVDVSQPLTRPEGPARLDLLNEPATRAALDELLAQRLARKAGGLEGLAIDGVLGSRIGPEAFLDAFLPFENLRLLRTGLADAAEAAILEEGLAAARVWTAVQAVQVVIDGVAAVAVTGDRRVQAIFTADPQGEAKLQLWKVASTDSAQVGEEVDFTIRFDNVGTRTIERVTLMDRLTPRLEYVEGSAQASRAARFSTEIVDGQTVLHWDFDEPLPEGEGGLVRFRCRVK